MKINTYRWLFYIGGLCILALGLTLNTKAGLGVSPIISVSYCISQITGFNFGDMTFLEYSIFVLVELVIHMRNKEGKTIYIMDLLQIVLSMIFTRFLNVYSAFIPDFSTSAYFIRIIVLLLAIILTGIGAAMSLNMMLVPNPGDGIVSTIALAYNIKVGTTKNAFDISMVCLTVIFSLICTHHIIGVGIGTVLAMLFVGRVIALYNYLFKAKTMKLAEI